MGEHALAFRVARLHPDATDQSTDRSDPLSPSTDASSSRFGGFGTVYLGQTLTLAVALVNVSQVPVNNVGTRVSLSPYLQRT